MLTRSQTTRRLAWGTLAATMVATIVTAVAPIASATPPPPNAGPPSGDGIRWDDILADLFPSFWIGTHQALEILDMRVVTINSTVGDGKKLASDPARKLARNLLAAQLNLGSGACSTSAVLAAVVQAEQLLDKYDFDGKLTTAYPINKRGADAALARDLAGYLDQYNNGMICSGS